MKDLEFLKNADSADLQVLVDYLTKNKNGNFRATECLSYTQNYHNYYPDRLPMMYNEIAEELMCFGGNTFRNIFRGGGPSYKTVLIDVCKKMKVNFSKYASVESIERNLLEKVLLSSLDQMTEEQLKSLMDEMNIPTKGFGKQAMIAALQIAIKKGGFASYRIAVIVANAICRLLLGRGLSLSANAALTRSLCIFAGPICWVVTAVWTLLDIAGPAYRVTIPAVIQVAYMRAKMQYKLLEQGEYSMCG